VGKGVREQPVVQPNREKGNTKAAKRCVFAETRGIKRREITHLRKGTCVNGHGRRGLLAGGGEPKA